MTVSIINTLKISQECNSASSTIEGKNFEIESLCYKALEIVEKKNLVVGISTRADTIDDLLKSGIASDLIQANVLLRWLEDNHEIFLIEDSGLLKVITDRNISSFDRRQEQLQQEWLGVREFGPSCAIEEAREIAAAAIVREEEEQEQQQQQKKNKKEKRRPYHRHKQRQPNNEQADEQLQHHQQQSGGGGWRLK